MSEITPRTNTQLIGHNDAESLLQQGLDSGKLAHGWLITGPKGIGKATLAYQFARQLLSGKPADELSENDPVFKRIVAGSHTDLLVVERRYDEKKDEYKQEIAVEQVREIAQFLSMTAGEGRWRVVIIDAVDALNANGANAILKILEEPPANTILLLIAHNPGRLLPTIRSRCRMLKLIPLDKSAFTTVMRSISPGIDSLDLHALAELSNYSPGAALEIYEQNGIQLYLNLLTIAVGMDLPDFAAINKFADSIAGAKAQGSWPMVTQLLLTVLWRVTLHSQGIKLTSIHENELEQLQRLRQMHVSAVWPGKWQQAADQFLLAERLHLDYKHIMITFFHSLPSREGFQLGINAA